MKTNDLLYDFQFQFIPKVIRTITEDLKDVLSGYDITEDSEYDMSGDFGCKFRIVKNDLNIEVTIHYAWLGNSADKGFFINFIGTKGNSVLDDSICHPLSLYSNGFYTLIKVIENGDPVKFCQTQIDFFAKSLENMEETE